MNHLFKINLKEYLIVALILCCFLACVEFFNLDFLLIKPFYSELSPHWPFKDLFWTQTVFHKGGVNFVIFLYLISIILFIYKKGFKTRTALAHILISVTLSIALISLLKNNNPILCPWDLRQFSGPYEYRPLTQFFNLNLAAAHCFPAGHASGGYAWLSIFFLV